MSTRIIPAGVGLALAVGYVLQVLHSGHVEQNEPPWVVHWLRDSLLLAPAAALSLHVGATCTRRALRWAQLPDAHPAGRATSALATATALALMSAPGNAVHGRVFGAEHAQMTFIEHAARDGSIVLLAVVATAAIWTLARAAGRAASRGVASPIAGAGLAVAATALAGLFVIPPLLRPDPAHGGLTSCPATARKITYDVVAFQTPIPINGWGDRMPDGLTYALKSRRDQIDPQRGGNPNLTEPIVIRANVGDCVTVKLENDIQGRRVGLHADGAVRAEPADSDGARVGNNPDSTVPPGGSKTYVWYADRVGQGVLTDIANLNSDAGEQTGPSSIQRGLYGAVIVHPTGSVWRNPRTGASMLNGANEAVETHVFADIAVPGSNNDLRSFAMIFMDENEGVKDAQGNQPTFPATGLPDSTFGMNYRSEPLRNRLRAVLDHRAGKQVTLPNGRVIAPDDHFCDGYVPELGKVVDDPGAKCEGEESHLQSWPFGDEGKLTRKVNDKVVTDSDLLIPKAYVGDRVTFHVINPGAKETHPYHQHTQRWFADPGNTNSPRDDVQSIGPGEARELTLEVGAGGVQKTIGDSIFHCHLYPHFAQGFWGHLRIFDRLRDGTQAYPDGTQLEPLKELGDRAGQTPAPDAAHPGFPLFVKGDVGQRAYRPPNAVVKDTFAGIRRPGDAPRGPTKLETDNLPALSAPAVSTDGKTNATARPGSGFIDPCPTSARLRTYRPHAVDGKITYNTKADWQDPEGRFYVEESQLVNGRVDPNKNPEPYTIRARLGECVQVLTTNDLHLDDDPAVPIDHLNDKDGVYQSKIDTTEVSTHVHLVQFDELGSDGTSVGWNYVQAAMPGQTYGYRWYVDQALRTVFFHDHQYANSHQQKGLYAAMMVEPADATWHDPKTGVQTDGTGPVADIRTSSGPDFRELSVFYQDRSPMWKGAPNGRANAVDPPPNIDQFQADQGGMGLNYRNEPFQVRTGRSDADAAQKADPAYVYSSVAHWDPSTPVFKAYPGDPVVVRHMTGAHEEVHTFNIHGHRWLSQPDNPLSNSIDAQTTALGEYFNYELSGGTVTKKKLSSTDTLRRATRAGEHGNGVKGVPLVLQGGAGPPGDYLYGSTSLDDQWLGMWGLFRVFNAKSADLQPLPDRAAPPTTSGRSAYPAMQPGASKVTSAAAAPPGETAACPATALVRKYSVSAIQHDIVYNAGEGDHDPNGLMFVLDEDQVDGRLAAGRSPEPLVIRARAGECVELKLTNRLPAAGLPEHTGDVPVPANATWPRSKRVSMHPALVRYDVTRADGAAVGFNYDGTVGPGESITYKWFADTGLQGTAANLVDLADRRGHRHHGLFGGLSVTPPNATWTHPTTGAPLTSGAIADIKVPGTGIAYREFVLNLQDGLNLRTPGGQSIPAPGDVDDPEDLGNRGINYRTERFAPRLQRDGEPANVMSSTVHGDPATPVLRAYVGDSTHIRVLQGGDRARAHTFLLSGHRWPEQLFDAASMQRSTVGGVEPQTGFTLRLQGGAAGGSVPSAGDYLFRDGGLINQVNGGLWGILRVHGGTVPTLKPLK